MIWVNISGGLGNQIIQICFAARLKNEIKTKVCVCSVDVDESFIDPQILDLLKVLNLEFSNTPKSKIGRRSRRLLSFNSSRITFFKYFDEDCISHCLLRRSRHLIFDGYWQSAKNIQRFFDMDSSILRDIFCRKYFYSSVYSGDTIVIHFRAGDYKNLINRLIFFQQEINYYLTALKTIFDFESKRLLICSNGTLDEVNEFVSALKINAGLSDSSVEIFSGSAVETFQVMLDSKYLIGANSTFSLAAFVLSQSNKSLGIFPKRWFRFFDHPLRIVSDSNSSILLR